MATFTTAGVNNLWSNNANWDVPPSDGSTWTIPVGQTCEFDIDMDGLGYTGMGAGTINGELKASTTTGSYVLKQGATITMGSAGIFRAGSSGSRYPADCSFHLMFTGAYRITCGGNGNIQFWCQNPTNKYAIMVGAGAKSITGVSQADPCEITCVGHGFATNDYVYLTGIGGMTEITDQRFCITKTSNDTFTIKYVNPLVTVDSSGFTSYTTGGLACPSTAEASTKTELHIDRNLSADPDWPVGARVRVTNWNRAASSEPASPTPFHLDAVGSDSVTISAGLTASKLSGSLVVLVSRNVRISGVTGTGYVINGNTTGGHQFDVEISDCNMTTTSAYVLYYASTTANPSSFTAGCLSHYYVSGSMRGMYRCDGLIMNGGTITGYEITMYVCNYSVLSDGLISGSYYGPYACYGMNMTGGLIHGCTNGHCTQFGLNMTGGIIRGCGFGFNNCSGTLSGGLVTNCDPVVFQGSMVIGAAVITGNTYALSLSFGSRILPSAIIRGNGYLSYLSSFLATGGSVTKETAELRYWNKYEGYGLALSSQEGFINTYTGTYMDPRDGVHSWQEPGGVAGFDMQAYAGTMADRTGGDPDFSATHGQTYTFRFYNADQPFLLDIPIWLHNGMDNQIVIDIKAQLENSGISWTAVPTFAIFRPGEDPLDGGTVESIETMVDNEVAQTFTMNYVASAATRGEFVTFRISGTGGNGTTSQYLYIAWKVSYGITP